MTVSDIQTNSPNLLCAQTSNAQVQSFNTIKNTSEGQHTAQSHPFQANSTKDSPRTRLSNLTLGAPRARNPNCQRSLFQEKPVALNNNLQIQQAGPQKSNLVSLTNLFNQLTEPNSSNSNSSDSSRGYFRKSFNFNTDLLRASSSGASASSGSDVTNVNNPSSSNQPQAEMSGLSQDLFPDQPSTPQATNSTRTVNVSPQRPSSIGKNTVAIPINFLSPCDQK